MTQDDHYRETSAAFGAALERLARSYEADPDKRRDLLQEMHIALWRSFGTYAEQCSLRTWVYRVAHNVAASHVLRQRRSGPRFLTLDEIEHVAAEAGGEPALDRQLDVGRLYALIHQLNPLERQVILLYLEGLDAAAIGEVVGMSAGNVSTRVHRVKKVLAARFHDAAGPKEKTS